MFKIGDRIRVVKPGKITPTGGETSLKSGSCFLVVSTQPKRDGIGYMVCIETPQFGHLHYWDPEERVFRKKPVVSWYAAERFELVEDEEDLYV